MANYQANIEVRVDDKSTNQVNNLEKKLKSITDKVNALKNKTVKIQQAAEVGTVQSAAKRKTATRTAMQERRATLSYLARYDGTLRSLNKQQQRFNELRDTKLLTSDQKRRMRELVNEKVSGQNDISALKRKRNLPGQGAASAADRAAAKALAADFKALNDELAEFVELKTKAYKKPIGPAQAPAAKVINKRMATENIDAYKDAQIQRKRFANQINELEAKGINTTKLRQKLGQFTDAQARRRYGTLRMITKELKQQLATGKSLLAQEKSNTSGFPSSPTRGIKSMVGSPEYKKAQAGIEDKAETALQNLKNAEDRFDQQTHRNKISQIKKEEAIELEAIRNTAAEQKRKDAEELQAWNEEFNARQRQKRERSQGLANSSKNSTALRRLTTLRAEVEKFNAKGFDVDKKRAVLDQAEQALNAKDLEFAKERLDYANALLQTEREINKVKNTSQTKAATTAKEEENIKQLQTSWTKVLDVFSEYEFKKNNAKSFADFLAGDSDAYKNKVVGPLTAGDSLRTDREIREKFNIALPEIKTPLPVNDAAIQAFDAALTERVNRVANDMERMRPTRNEMAYAPDRVGPKESNVWRRLKDDTEAYKKTIGQLNKESNNYFKQTGKELNSLGKSYNLLSQSVDARQKGSQQAARQILDDLGDELREVNRVRNARMKVRNERRKQRIDAGRQKRIFNSRTQQRRGAGLLGDRGESLALGVGFPLMFGAGPGSVLGSGLGSFVGKQGFGGQILGGAIGMMIDQFVASIGALGVAAMESTKYVDMLSERMIFATREQQKALNDLAQNGYGVAANLEARDALVNLVGANGFEDLKEAGAAVDELGREWARFTTVVQASMAGLFAEITKSIASAIAATTQARRIDSFGERMERQGVSESTQRKFKSRYEEIKRETIGKYGTGADNEYVRLTQQLIREFEEQVPELKIKLVLTDVEKVEQQLEELSKYLSIEQKMLSALNLVDKFSEKQRQDQQELEDAEERRWDAINNAIDQVEEKRVQIARRIEDIELENINKQNQLYTVQRDIRLQTLRNTNANLLSEFSTDEVTQAAEAIFEYTEKKQEIENQIAERQLNTELETQKLRVNTARYQADVAKEIAKLQTDLSKQQAELDKEMSRRAAKRNAARSALELRIAKRQMQQLQLEAKLEQIRAKRSRDQEAIKLANELVELVDGQATAMENLKTTTKDGKTTESKTVDIVFNVDSSGIDDAIAKQINLIRTIETAKGRLDDLVLQGANDNVYTQLENIFQTPFVNQADNALGQIQLLLNYPDLEKSTIALAANAARVGVELDRLITLTKDPALKDFLTQLRDLNPGLVQLAATNEFLRSKTEGYTSELQSLKLEQTGLMNVTGLVTEEQRLLAEMKARSIDVNTELAQSILDVARALDEERLQTEALRQEKGLQDRIDNAGRGLKAGFINEGAEAYNNALDAGLSIDKAQELGELANQAAMVEAKFRGIENAINATAGAIGTLMTRGVSEMINGTKTAQEVFSEFLNTIANALLDAAAQMIATYIAIGIARAFAMGSPAPDAGDAMNGGGSLPWLNPGETWPSSYGSIPGRASGGRTLPDGSYIVGERGPEIFKPDSPGTISSNRAFDAARDSMSIDADTMASNASEQRENNFYEAMQSPEGREMNVKYDATIINEVEYVTADQFQRGMKDTATRARAETLKDLRNYPSKRAAVGMR